MSSMKWRRVLLIAVALIAVSAGAYHFYSVRARKKREAKYQQRLNSCTEIFHTDENRKAVEDYFRSHGTQFGKVLGPGSLTSWSDYVRIGEEPAPWYCSNWEVYVMFDFAAVEKHNPWDGRDSDLLKKIRLASHGEGCL